MTVSDVLERDAIVERLDDIDSRLGTLVGYICDRHRVLGDGEDPNMILHTPVSAILELVDAVRELKQEVSAITDIVRERKSV